VTVLAIFLSGEKDVYIDVRPTLILSATTTQLNLYELASSNRNAATRNEKVHGRKRFAKELVLACCCCSNRRIVLVQVGDDAVMRTS
jgi:hypothetical protein